MVFVAALFCAILFYKNALSQEEINLIFKCLNNKWKSK